MTTLGSDTFTRSNTSNGTWGTATDSETWARPFGSATTYSVTSNEGVIGSTPSTWDHFVLGTNTISSTMDVVVRIIPDNTASNFGVLLRVSSAGTTSYKVMYQGNSGTKGLYLYYDSPGTGLVQIGSLSAFTVTVGTAVWIRGQINGSTLMGKIWTTSEPGSWTISSSVGTNTISSGGFGVVGAANSNLKFDSFTATDGSTVVNQTVTYTNKIATAETVTNAIKALPGGVTAIGEQAVIAQKATAINTTTILESSNAGTFQFVTQSNITATSEMVSVTQKAIPVGLTANIESLLAAQRVLQSNKTALSESVTATNLPITSSSDPDAQMLYGDLLIEYAVLRASAANPNIAKIGIALYPPARVLNEYAVPGYLAVRLNGEDWTQHHKLRTINEVNAFITAHS